MPNWTTACPDCPRKYRAIGGDGPQPAPVLCALERPGQDENRHGRVACGNTGQELDELYLPLAGLERERIRVCNTVLCWADGNRAPTADAAMRCAAYHLPAEIKRTKPEVIILAGATPCSLVPGIRLELHHGVPQHTRKVGTLFGWSGWLLPMYHPSIGLHESRWMQICMEDWQAVGQFLTFGDDGDPEPERTDYEAIDSPRGLRGMEKSGTLGIDTESHNGRPWSVQVSWQRGFGVLIKAEDKRTLRHLAVGLDLYEVVLHNAAYDLEVLRKLGIPVVRFRDTMQEAFHLGNLPQGLKPLVYRLFRHTMTSYDETVRPASIRALQEWMLEASVVAERDLSYQATVKLKTKTKEVVKPGPLSSLLTRALRLSDVASEYDPWERLNAFWADPLNGWMTAHVEARCGPYPRLGIANCTTEEAVRYAVGDADWTARVAVELERRRNGAFRIYDGDRDGAYVPRSVHQGSDRIV